MQILFLDSVGSTQTHLKNLLRDSKVKAPYGVVANQQTAGLGSRNNSWSGLDGNLFLSFAISIDKLPKDLKLESASIYFAYILKETLEELGSKVWLKWPNDFYIDERKIGGMITNIVGNDLTCGVGLNLLNSPDGFSTLDIKVSKEILLKNYFINIQKNYKWKQIFSNYKLQFHLNRKFYTHNEKKRVSLSSAELLSDGSIMLDGKRIYSLR